MTLDGTTAAALELESHQVRVAATGELPSGRSLATNPRKRRECQAYSSALFWKFQRTWNIRLLTGQILLAQLKKEAILIKEQKIIDFLTKRGKETPLKFFLKPFFWSLRLIDKVFMLFPEFRAMRIFMEINKLEQKNNYEEARRLREKWLRNQRIANYPDLWFSQGNDFLFRKDEPHKALQAYERAIGANKDFQPIELYYGATCSAFLENQTSKAKKYYLLFNDWWSEVMENPELKKYYSSHFLTCKNWLDSRMKNF